MSNGEREKCHKIHCPNHPAWIPAGQNGCPHCGGTATRGFCICEPASADEIRDMYTPPAHETPHDDGCGGCDLGICTPSETPSPEVGMVDDAYEAWLRLPPQNDYWLNDDDWKKLEQAWKSGFRFAKEQSK